MPYDDEIGDSSFVMLGSIIGDIIGSAYEFHNVKTKDFTLFPPAACFTDDTILTCAVAAAGAGGNRFGKERLL